MCFPELIEVANPCCSYLPYRASFSQRATLAMQGLPRPLGLVRLHFVACSDPSNPPCWRLLFHFKPWLYFLFPLLGIGCFCWCLLDCRCPWWIWLYHAEIGLRQLLGCFGLPWVYLWAYLAFSRLLVLQQRSQGLSVVEILQWRQRYETRAFLLG